MQQPLWPLLLNAQAWLVYTRAHADVHTKEVALYGMLSKVNRIFSRHDGTFLAFFEYKMFN